MYCMWSRQEEPLNSTIETLITAFINNSIIAPTQTCVLIYVINFLSEWNLVHIFIRHYWSQLYDLIKLELDASPQFQFLVNHLFTYYWLLLPFINNITTSIQTHCISTIKHPITWNIYEYIYQKLTRPTL